MKKLEIRRMDRVATIWLNLFFVLITAGIALIFNLVFYSVHGKTAGSYFMGFATRKEDGSAPGFDGAMIYWISRTIMRFLYVITFGILYLYDVSTLERRNGSIIESLLGQRKVNNFSE